MVFTAASQEAVDKREASALLCLGTCVRGATPTTAAGERRCICGLGKFRFLFLSFHALGSVFYERIMRNPLAFV